jgi:hypothetical protein
VPFELEIGERWNQRTEIRHCSSLEFLARKDELTSFDYDANRKDACSERRSGRVAGPSTTSMWPMDAVSFRDSLV